MIALIKYYDRIFGSQNSVRAGTASEIAYQILIRDNGGVFDGLKELDSKFQASAVTEEDITNLSATTQQGSVTCIAYSVRGDDKELLIQKVLEISERKRKRYPDREKLIQNYILSIQNDDYNAINSLHHID